LDANLLVLLIVGSAQRSYIKKHRRLRAYNENDLNILLEFISPMSAIIVTPNILTEASNLASQTAEPARTQIARVFQSFVERFQERYVDSKRAVVQPEFPRLWLADSGVLAELANAHLLLTTDLDLYLAASRRGNSAVNFNHLRRL
jgi:hypothetical protein